MATTFKFGNGNWAVKEDYALAYNDENGNFKPLPFDFTRGSSATRVNKDGLIENVPSGKPRIDFLNNTSGHLLLEPSRTNNVPYSVFDADVPTGWAIGFGTGTFTHELTTFRGQPAIKHTQLTTGRSYLNDGLTLAASTTYTFSMYVDLENSGDIVSNEVIAAVSISGDSGDDEVTFGEIDQNTGLAKFTFTTGTSTSCNLRIGLGAFGNTNQLNKPLIFSMPQLEIGSYPTSYIPTEGSNVTRSAETANGAGNSTVFNDSEGVLYVETSKLSTSDNGGVAISNGSYTHRVVLYFDNSGNVRGQVYSSGAQANIITSGLDYTQNNKFALKYSATSTKFYVNGSQVGSTDTSSTMPVGLSELAFDDGGGGSDFYGKIKDVRVYDTALSDSELQALTS
jgi:hypothetical protein